MYQPHQSPDQQHHPYPPGWVPLKNAHPGAASTLTSAGSGMVTIMSAEGPSLLSPAFGLSMVNQHQGSRLPLPGVLKSQPTPPKCAVCNLPGCTLSSHRKYSPETPTALSPGWAFSMPQGTTSAVPASQAMGHSMVLDEEGRYLLDLWTNPWASMTRGPERHLFPKPFINDILPAVSQSPPLCHALLALSATGSSLARGQVDERAFRHHLLAVESLSSAYLDETAASSDEAVLAGIIVVLVYMLQDNVLEFTERMQKLNYLVNLRGGPHYLSLRGSIANALVYADHLRAISTGTAPVWTFLLPRLDFTVVPQGNGRGFQALANLDLIHPDLLQAAQSVCKLTDVFDAGARGQMLAGAENIVGYLSGISEFQLAQCDSSFHGTSTRNECVCLALLLFNHVVLRNDGSITPFTRKLEYRFWNAFQLAEASGHWQVNNVPFLMWVLLTGLVVTTRGRSQFKEYGVQRMKHLVGFLESSNWHALKQDILGFFLWLPAAQEEIYSNLWFEVVI